MGSFSRDNKRSGGNNRFGGSRDGGRPTMHRATCNDCGDSCQVPFRPTGSKPVYCSECFGQQNDGGGRQNNYSNNRQSRSRFDDKQMHSAVCAKCGDNCQVPFRPTTSKPVFCNDCFGKNDGKERGGGSRNTGKGSGEVMEQIKILNSKVDKLLKLLSPTEEVKKKETKKTEKAVKVKKVVKKEKKEKKVVKTKKATKKATKKVALKKPKAEKKK